MTKKKKTVKLKDLLGKDKASNADLHEDGEGDRRKWHKAYRVPRHQLITSKGMEYTRLSENVETDIKRNELAREFISNGFRQTRAYAAVYGVTLRAAGRRAGEVFASEHMRTLIRNILLGTDDEAIDELPKSWLITRLMDIVENNLLDFMGDDGRIYNVAELKRLPRWQQEQIKKLEVHERTAPKAIEDKDGNILKDENGLPFWVPVTEQHVVIELHDKLRASDLLAKAMQWIAQNVDVTFNFITGKDMLAAEARVKRLRRDAIEGEAKRTATG